jgi:hypothetical protein
MPVFQHVQQQNEYPPRNGCVGVQKSISRELAFIPARRVIRFVSLGTDWSIPHVLYDKFLNKYLSAV